MGNPGTPAINTRSVEKQRKQQIQTTISQWRSDADFSALDVNQTMQPCEANIQLFQDICCFLAIENALRTETGRIRKATFDVTILGPLDEVSFHRIAPKKIHQAGSPRESLLNINWN